jgi:hypothetical protein
MSLTKVSLGGNNLIIPAQGEFGTRHPGWGLECRVANLFYSVVLGLVSDPELIEKLDS